MARITVPTPQMEDTNLALGVAEMRDRMGDAAAALNDAQVCRRFLKATILDLAQIRTKKVADAAVVYPPLAGEAAD